MQIDDSRIDAWIDEISSLDGIVMDPDDLVDDVLSIAEVCQVDDAFDVAMQAVKKALQDVLADRVSVKRLEGNLSDWYKYSFQSVRQQKRKADMRVCFRRDDRRRLRVRGFGFRHYPVDFYLRTANRML